jgi:HEAT repeat protein
LPFLLGHLDFTIGHSLLLEAMSSNDQLVRLAATETVGRKGGQADIAVLNDAVEKTSDLIELTQLAWSLGRIGQHECIPELLRLVQKPAPQVHATAAEALAQIAQEP